MNKPILSVALLVVMLPLMAQIDMPCPNLNPYAGSGNSLLNLNNLSMRHSMGFEAGTATHGDGYYLSRYTNHLIYSFNPKLVLDLDLNFVNFGSMNTKDKFELNSDNSTKVVPEFSLRYKPKDNILIQFQMVQGGLYRSYRDSLQDNFR